MTSLQNHGLVATLVDESGKELCRVFGFTDNGSGGKGNPKRRLPIGVQVWMRELIEYCDAHQLKIRVISTPQTIVGDLESSRCALGLGQSLTMPEVTMLSKMGRLDLYEPLAKKTTAPENPYTYKRAA